MPIMAKTYDRMPGPRHQASRSKQRHEDKTSFYGSSCANNGKGRDVRSLRGCDWSGDGVYSYRGDATGPAAGYIPIKGAATGPAAGYQIGVEYPGCRVIINGTQFRLLSSEARLGDFHT
eukprot:1190324-Prorocentrum_minimum.AAC.2